MKINESLFVQRHGEKIEAVLRSYDRLVITGTLLDVAYPAAVQHRLNERDLRCFELGEFAEPLREADGANCEPPYDLVFYHFNCCTRRDARSRSQRLILFSLAVLRHAC